MFGIVTPDTQELVRDASILFDVAVDRRNGNLYLVWQDVRFNGVDEVAFSMSTDGGNTWSSPVKINKTPPNANPLRQQVFVPSIEVAANGELVVTYYDFRFDTDDGRERADHLAVFCDAATLRIAVRQLGRRAAPDDRIVRHAAGAAARAATSSATTWASSPRGMPSTRPSASSTARSGRASSPGRFASDIRRSVWLGSRAAIFVLAPHGRGYRPRP